MLYFKWDKTNKIKKIENQMLLKIIKGVKEIQNNLKCKKFDLFNKSKSNIKLLDENEDEKKEAEDTLNDLRQQIMLNHKKRSDNNYFDTSKFDWIVRQSAEKAKEEHKDTI